MQIEKRLEKLKKGKAKDSQSKLKEDAEKSAMERIRHALMDGKPARSVTLTDFEKDAVNHLCLLKKPVIYVENVAESDLADSEINPYVKEVMNLASEIQSGLVTISAQVWLNQSLQNCHLKNEVNFFNSLGDSESYLGNLSRATYSLLGLCTHFASGEKETKAWTILSGMTAPQAAGVIHSDFEKGFIRAETVGILIRSFDFPKDFCPCASPGLKTVLFPLRKFIYLHCLSVAVENSSRRRCNAVSFQRLTVIILNINTSCFFSNTIKLVNNLNTAQVKERF
ncbi:hypothetical protein POTOM_041314 [Populus tomentosa]|uniref:YchF C-terminal domain-containing protein n=1 Tax=Populus tomentosa TaxID=118781 RepID=A0A8X7YMD2_POPTO|nr:hypothetical protein POTOM_041314 [Populus tomentosa]